MCNQCNDANHNPHDGVLSSRRELLIVGAGLTATPLLAGATSSIGSLATGAAPTGASDGPLGQSPMRVRAYGAANATAPMRPIEIQRQALGAKDVLIDVLYCGICHSDVHQVRNEWSSLPTQYPCVPGHEIVGSVLAVGKDVSKFKVGDAIGVGCMVNACGECENCLDDREQNCLKGATFTYNSALTGGGHTLGGYSDRMVVAEHFGIRIPTGADLAATAPLLCAGITTFSPMQHWKLERDQRVGVIGFGGLGHMAVKLAVARGAEVTVFTTSPSKFADARRMGARQVVLSSDADALGKLENHFDLLIAAVPYAFPMQPFINLLKLDATLVNVGALDGLQGIDGMALAFGRKAVAGSVIGGIAETQQVVDYCAARNIKAEIELIRPDQINQAFDRVVGKDVRYRFVIDFASAKSAT
ncbi:NAD(P)-dependent alcohol dehydrogenase [Pseudomonas putida]|uniref:NAD(P)-dependent alcohol dehydrogenase n=1 Tax=Pseudomonas putida TaxID=303 RepID=UPI000F7AE97A|nr:NAD(P)-dependent alcohol dehydrogenase [Pseudomonas putida]